MQRFLITPESRIVTIHQQANVPEGGTAFQAEEELLKATADWPTSRLLEIWNGLAGVTEVRKFRDRATAVGRIWKAIQALPAAEELEAEAPQADPIPEAAHSKKAQLIALLEAEGGVTLAQLMSASGWQKHSVRGFLSGTVGKQMGLSVASFKNSNGERVYRVVR